jgi:quercetin dioxygenase-like cupin family protein
MNQICSRIVRVSAVVAVMAVAGGPALHSQQAPTVKRNILLREDMSNPDRQAVMVLVELPPGAAEGRHTHPAELYAFVLEGVIALESEGSPTATLKAGDVVHVAPGKVHQAVNNGNVTAKLVAVFVAEKGKPLSTPAK